MQGQSRTDQEQDEAGQSRITNIGQFTREVRCKKRKPKQRKERNRETVSREPHATNQEAMKNIYGEKEMKKKRTDHSRRDLHTAKPHKGGVSGSYLGGLLSEGQNCQSERKSRTAIMSSKTLLISSFTSRCHIMFFSLMI